MQDAKRRGEWAAVLTLTGMVLFNRPLISLFDQGAGAVLLGIPLLYLYLFGAWAVLIALLALVMARPESGDGPPPDGP